MDRLLKDARSTEEWPRCRYCGTEVWYDMQNVQRERMGGQSHHCPADTQRSDLAAVRRIQARYGEEQQ